MKSSIRNVMIVSACAVVLGGALTALLLSGGNGGDAASSSSAGQSIELVSKKKQDISSMKVTNSKGSYTLIPVKSASSLTSQTSAAASSLIGSSSSAVSSEEDITYTVKELEGFPINTAETDSVVKDGFSLVATRNLGTVSNLEDYGLKNPEATVEVTFTDGSTYNYKIGKTSASDSSARYMCGMDSDNVYIVSVDLGMLEGPSYFVNTVLLSLDDQSSEDEFTQIKLSGTAYPQAITIAKSGDALKITAPSAFELDSTKLSNLETALKSLTADSVEALNPDAAALAGYGLDKPSAVVEFTVKGKRYKLEAGASKEGNTYVMLDGVSCVYSVSTSSIEAWSAESLFSLRDHILFMPNIATVKSMTITAGSTVNELNVTREKDEKKSTEDTPYYTYTLTGNGAKALDYDKNYKAFYQNVIGITLLEDADKKPDGSPELTIRYQYFDQSGTDQIEFYKSGDRRYTAVLNGVVYGTVTQDDIDLVQLEIQQLEDGKSVS